MTDTQPNIFLSRLNDCKDAGAVDKLFTEINALPKDQRGPVLDAIEAFAVRETIAGHERPQELAQVRMIIEVLEGAKGTPQGKIILAQLEAQGFGEESLAISQIMLNLHQAKGDDAHKGVKIYVEEAAKLSDEEYGTTFGQLKLMMAAGDRIAALDKPAPARGNPFRPKDDKPAAP